MFVVAARTSLSSAFVVAACMSLSVLFSYGNPVVVAHRCSRVHLRFLTRNFFF